MSIEYYLGSLGNNEDSSVQARSLREIVLSKKSGKEIFYNFEQFVLSQEQLYPDTVCVINKSIMAGYGCEYFGLGKDDFSGKCKIYKQVIDKFPLEHSFKFHYADCCLMDNRRVEEIYPTLREGMVADKENIYYPSADLFYLLHSSIFSFDFDMLLLDKYYQPCDIIEFEEWIEEFRERYQSEKEQIYLNQLQWKGNAST